MARTVVIVCVLFLSACSNNNSTSDTTTDSTVYDSTAPGLSEDNSALLPTYVYDRSSTYEGQFEAQLQTSSQEITDREGLIGLSQPLVMNEKNDIVVRGGDENKLWLVIFREGEPVLKLTNCRNITFVNISFGSEHERQALVELSGCNNITFESCRFMFGEELAVVETNSENVNFLNCAFGGPGSPDEEPPDEAYDEVSEEEAVDEGAVRDNEKFQASYAVDWTTNVNSFEVPRMQENLNYFVTNQYFSAMASDQMNYASYSVLEFGRDFFTPVDWKQETNTWTDGSDVDTYMPGNCDEFDKIKSLTRTRRKLWYIHRKISFEQEYGADANDRWRDDNWYRNRSYYTFLFDNRNSAVMEQVWNVAKPYLSGQATITKQEYDDALLFIDELLLYYAKVSGTPYWEGRFNFIAGLSANLSSADHFYRAGFPLHSNACMREGYTGGNYITGYDLGNEAWMYGFWLRRNQEGNMDIVRDILLWAKAEMSKRA